MKISQTIQHVILILVLLCNTSGIPVVIHTCGGEIESVHVFATSAKCEDASDCEDDDCCKNFVVIQQWQYDGVSVHAASLSTQQELTAILTTPVVISPISLCAAERNAASTVSPYFRPPPLLMSMRC